MALKGILSALVGESQAMAQAAARAMLPTKSRGILRPVPDARLVERVRQTAPMTSAQQWQKVATVLNSSIDAANTAKSLQAEVAQQLDLATYALYKLFDELAPVMNAPLVREAAVVHRLSPKVRRAQVQALAA